jgi:hypothetical protein
MIHVSHRESSKFASIHRKTNIFPPNTFFPRLSFTLRLVATKNSLIQTKPDVTLHNDTILKNSSEKLRQRLNRSRYKFCINLSRCPFANREKVETKSEMRKIAGRIGRNRGVTRRG